MYTSCIALLIILTCLFVVDDVKYNDVRDYIIRKSLKIQKDSN